VNVYKVISALEAVADELRVGGQWVLG